METRKNTNVTFDSIEYIFKLYSTNMLKQMLNIIIKD